MRISPSSGFLLRGSQVHSNPFSAPVRQPSSLQAGPTNYLRTPCHIWSHSHSLSDTLRSHAPPQPWDRQAAQEARFPPSASSISGKLPSCARNSAMRACLATLPLSRSFLSFPKLLLRSWRCHLGRVFTGSSSRSRVASPPPNRSGLQHEGIQQPSGDTDNELCYTLHLCAPFTEGNSYRFAMHTVSSLKAIAFASPNQVGSACGTTLLRQHNCVYSA